MDDFSALQAKVERLETIVNSLSENMASLNKEVLSLKEQANNREQQFRSNSIRVFGLSISEEEANDTSGKVLSKRVYDAIIKPVLVAAKANKQIDVFCHSSSTPSLMPTESGLAVPRPLFLASPRPSQLLSLSNSPLPTSGWPFSLTREPASQLSLMLTNLPA